MNGLTAADFADTGQWRLIVKLYHGGISAHLENTIHKDLEPQLLFSEEWEQDPDTLLRHIENAVYDHPRVLDDFSARIIVFDPKTIFFPTHLMEEHDGAEETFYTAVYEADPADVMTDTFGSVTAAYSPAPGLKGFLSRTFPGAKVESHLMEYIRKFSSQDEGVRMYVTVRKGEADFVLLNNDELLTASTHPVKATEDVVYHLANIVEVYGFSIPETAISILPYEGAEELESKLSSIGGECKIIS
ncbi:MAG: DUF3822 family protein [Muribaculaceae bacterium]|nr:DUF3822 family protein [Muribaculaceae bacterium]MDE6754872.1 DUF3822 family protein [Muribaculaceae bacterium]